MRVLRFLLLAIPILLGLGYVGLCAILYFEQDALLFFPAAVTERDLVARADAAGFDPWLDARGERIGWKSRAGSPSPAGDQQTDALIIFHGNGGYALGSHYDQLRPSSGANAGFQVYLLEYPGYGRRPGPPSARSFVVAAVEAVDLLAAVPARRIWIMGQSLGTGVACAAAASRPEKIAALVLITPYNSLSAAAEAHYPWLPIRLLLRHRLDSDQNLARYRGPVAFVLAGRDGTIPPRLGRKLYDGYAGPKRLWIAPTPPAITTSTNSLSTITSDGPAPTDQPWLFLRQLSADSFMKNSAQPYFSTPAW